MFLFGNLFDREKESPPSFTIPPSTLCRALNPVNVSSTWRTGISDSTHPNTPHADTLRPNGADETIHYSATRYRSMRDHVSDQPPEMRSIFTRIQLSLGTDRGHPLNLPWTLTGTHHQTLTPMIPYECNATQPKPQVGSENDELARKADSIS